MAGDAAVYVNPEEYGKVARELAGILADDDRRSALRQKGLENVKRFSWDKTGDLYKKVLFPFQ